MPKRLIPFDKNQARKVEAANAIVPLVNAIITKLSECHPDDRSLLLDSVIESLSASDSLVVQRMAEGVSELDYA